MLDKVSVHHYQKAFNMDKHTIKKLLDRYFEGETSLDEEQILKSYFTDDNVDAELVSFRPLFAFFVQEKQLKTSMGFSIASIQKPAKIIHLKVWRWAVAAILVLSISSWYFLNNFSQNKQVSQQIDWSKYEPKTKEQAIQLTFAAFKKTSFAIQKGTQMVGSEMKELKGLVKFE